MATLAPLISTTLTDDTVFDPFSISWSSIVLSTLMLATAIFGVIILNKDNKQGYIKNIAGMYANKGLFAISKFITISVAVIIWSIFGLGFAIATTNIFGGNHIVYSDFLHFVGISALGIFLNLCSISIMVFLTVLSRNSVPGIITGILVSSGIPAMIFNLLNTVINKLFGGTDFDISKLFPYNSLNTISYNPHLGEIIRMIIVGLVFVVAFNILSVIVSNKRDIK